LERSFIARVSLLAATRITLEIYSTVLPATASVPSAWTTKVIGKYMIKSSVCCENVWVSLCIKSMNETCVDEGNLHFANVRMEDGRNGSSYLCVVMNDELRSLAQGDDQRIEPVRRTGTHRSLSLLSLSYSTVFSSLSESNKFSQSKINSWKDLKGRLQPLENKP